MRGSGNGLLALAGLLVGISGVAAKADDGGGAYGAVRFISGGSWLDGIERTGNPPGTFEVTHGDDLEYVGIGALAVGYSFADRGLPVRIELEYQHRLRFDFDSRVIVVPAPVLSTIDYAVNLSSNVLMLNGYYDVVTGTPWQPYAGAGIGYARHDADTKRPNLTRTSEEEATAHSDNLAAAAMLGLRVRISANWVGELGYRFTWLGAVETPTFAGGDQVTADNYYSHDLVLGLSYLF
ncbi:MAG: outer membrane beta-barrel protein [Alphaproteobacteria bacterium]